MATTVTAADLTVTITESYSLNGVTYGNTQSKLYGSQGKVLQRILSITTGNPIIMTFSSLDAGGQVIVGDYAYFRIKNLDDTNFVMLSLFNSTDTFFYKLAAGETFLLMNNEMDAVTGTTFGSFATISQMKADADTATCDVEIFCVTA